MKSVSLFILLIPGIIQAQCNCRENFEFVFSKTKQNYAGWNDKVNTATKKRFEIFTDSLHTLATEAKSDSACFKLLGTWLTFFRDRHTSVYQPIINDESKGNRKPQRISLEKLNDQTFLLTLSSFRSTYKKTVDSLIQSNHDLLVQAKNLIIDLRNNSGGDDVTYSDIIPYLYTNPIKTINNSIYSSPDNIQKFEAIAANASYPESSRKHASFLAKKLKTAPGKFYRKEDRTIRLKNTLANPANIVILINKGCTSSCEEFVLAAKQSSKVVLMGENTGGVLDYANVHQLQLPCKGWWLQYATSRSNRLPEFPIDNIGIAPAVKIYEGENWLDAAVDLLNKR